MSSFKLIAFLFPFIKEMILGEKTVQEAIRTNKVRVFLIGLILLSFFLNIVFIPKLVKISADYVILDRKYKEMGQHPSKLSSQPVSKPTTKPEKPTINVKPDESTSFVNTPASPDQPVTPPPNPSQDTPPPAADIPPEPSKREKRRYYPPRGRREPPVSSSSVRYNEWKRTLDAIRSQEYREEHGNTGDNSSNQ